MSNNQMRIVIDTDPGTDDALALALASVYFKNEICAIISSYGNVGGIQTFNNLIALNEMLDFNCIILQGSQVPVSGNEIIYTNYHGKNGLCDISLPILKNKKNLNNNHNDSIKTLYEIIKSNKKIKYISMAPLTNFAKLLEYYPDVVNYVDELIVMGGGFNVFNAKEKTEYNFSLDGLAVKKVLNSSVKKIICPLDMTCKLSFSLNEIEKITGCKREDCFSSNSIYDFFSKIFYKNYDTAILHSENGAIIHDATTLIYLMAPDKCVRLEKKIISNDFGSTSEADDGNSVEIIKSIGKEYLADKLNNVFNLLKGDF